MKLTLRQRRTQRKKLLGPHIGITMLLATACAEQSPQTLPCDSPELLASAESLLVKDPLAAIGTLQGTSDCDDKLALMHAAEVEIARRAQDDYYYQGKVQPRGWYSQDPSPFTKYVLARLNRFESAGETANISANSFWLDQIQNRNHPALGTAELEAIREFDSWVWEDGDGFQHTEALLTKYRAWLARWPEHPQVPSVRGRISQLEESAT